MFCSAPRGLWVFSESFSLSQEVAAGKKHLLCCLCFALRVFPSEAHCPVLIHLVLNPQVLSNEL